MDPCTAAIVAAARRRGIPCLRHSEGASLVQLGWGRAARRVHATFTSETSHVAVRIARDKPLARSLLREAGVPVPECVVAATAQEAVDAARRLGTPVVVRPFDPRGSSDASTALRSADEVRAAFERARRHGERAMVEREIAGGAYRVLVVDGRCVAATRRTPPEVRSDGLRSVRELVDAENRRRADGAFRGVHLARIPVDEVTEETIARQGLTLDSVAPAGMAVRLRLRAELSAGAMVEDVTALAHREVGAACERAARAIGLDLAAIDLVCRDIALPLAAQDGGIVDVNAAPEIGAGELSPRGDWSRIAEAMVQALFPDGRDGRIPPIAVTGGAGATTALLVAHALEAAGMRTGVATSGGIRIGNDHLNGGDCTGRAHARALLGSPDVEAAVLEVAPADLSMSDPAFDRCDVAILAGPVETALSTLRAREGTASALRFLARSARALALDLDHPPCAAAARAADSQVRIVAHSRHAQSPAIAAHIGRGGTAVYLRRNLIMLAAAGQRIPLMDTDSIDVAGSIAGNGIADVLAASAGLVAFGLEPRAIAAAFGARPDAVPRRFGRASHAHP